MRFLMRLLIVTVNERKEMAVTLNGFTTSEAFVITDDHDANIPGTVPTSWLFFTGIDGHPGRYFLVVDGEIKKTSTGYWYGEHPASPGWLKVSMKSHTDSVGTVKGCHVWHERLGLKTPR